MISSLIERRNRGILTRLYRRYVDAVDFDKIRRIAAYTSMPAMRRGDDLGTSLALSLVEYSENSRGETIHDDDIQSLIRGELFKMKPDSGSRS